MLAVATVACLCFLAGLLVGGMVNVGSERARVSLEQQP